ncbi:MAG: hypothetical protein FJW35_05685 [Acidobacteria bacterium]|nr:hypothetical protein [Acidobacteriota bacterium]
MDTGDQKVSRRLFLTAGTALTCVRLHAGQSGPPGIEVEAPLHRGRRPEQDPELWSVLARYGPEFGGGRSGHGGL